MGDITRNLNAGDLSVLAAPRHYGFRMEQTPDMIKYHVKHNDETGDNNAQEFMRIGKIENNLLISNLTNEDYFSHEIPFYAVLNPHERGALGTAYDIRKGNALFVSGPLNGCSVAVLKKDHMLLFVHAGADAGTSGNVLDPNGVNNDLFRLVQMHERVHNNNQNVYLERDIAAVPLRPQEIADIFLNMGYSGIIYHPADQNRLQVYDRVSIQEYNAGLRSDIFAVTPNACHVLLIDSYTGDAGQDHIL